MADLAPGVLSRVVPQHVRTLRLRWVKTQWMIFRDFKAARSRMRLKVYETCTWCRKPFQDDDMLSLAGVEKGANKLLCPTCVGQIRADTSTTEPTK